MAKLALAAVVGLLGTACGGATPATTTTTATPALTASAVPTGTPTPSAQTSSACDSGAALGSLVVPSATFSDQLGGAGYTLDQLLSEQLPYMTRAESSLYRSTLTRAGFVHAYIDNLANPLEGETVIVVLLGSAAGAVQTQRLFTLPLSTQRNTHAFSVSQIPGAIGVAFTQNPVAGISAGPYYVAATEFTTGRLEIHVGISSTGGGPAISDDQQAAQAQYTDLVSACG
jgi:hypothetical protein